MGDTAVVWLPLPNQNELTDVFGSLALPEVGILLLELEWEVPMALT